MSLVPDRTQACLCDRQSRGCHECRLEQLASPSLSSPAGRTVCNIPTRDPAHSRASSVTTSDVSGFCRSSSQDSFSSAAFTHTAASDEMISLFPKISSLTPRRSDSASTTSSQNQDLRATRPANSNSSTPRTSADRSYSPMVAGFARLSMRNGAKGAASENKPRTGSGRSSLDEASRLFEGPA